MLSITVFVSCGITCRSQNFDVNGQFKGENLEKSFINIINTTQYISTISELDGKFNIPASVGDSILISSVQYKDIKFIVKPKFKSEIIEIPLELKINQLGDVNVYSYGLSGDLEKDAESITIREVLKLETDPFDITNAYDPFVTIEP